MPNLVPTSHRPGEPTVMVRDATASDLAAIAEIYNHYVRTSEATFEETEVDVEELSTRLRAIEELRLPWLVAEFTALHSSRATRVVGYAYANRWHKRSAFRLTVEASTYVAHDHTGNGVGSRLYRELLKRLEATPVRSVIGVVALPNAASVALHERLGFRKRGHLERVGFKFGRLIDVGYWQLELDDE